MTLAESHEPTPPTAGKPEFTAAEIGALAHLYRGEVYRSTVWRTRLDSSTNWAVVTTGIALSATYSSADASPLPLVLIGLLVTVFLLFEARRYRYFNVWRARAFATDHGCVEVGLKQASARGGVSAGPSFWPRTTATRAITSVMPARSADGFAARMAGFS